MTKRLRTPNYLGASVRKDYQHCQTLVGWGEHIAILVKEKPDVREMNPVEPTDSKPPVAAELVPTDNPQSGLTASMLKQC